MLTKLLRNIARNKYLIYKEDARRIVFTRLAFFNTHYNLTWRRIAIRDQRSRWGSCSARGNLNFNYRIALLPPELADYIIVHEMCHLVEMNHGHHFWQLVGETIPDWRQRRRALKTIRV